MTEIMPVPRNLILLSYQQRALRVTFLFAFCVGFVYNHDVVIAFLFDLSEVPRAGKRSSY